MKKFLFIASFLFAFSISANAQDNKGIDLAAQKDANALTEYLGLNENISDSFYRLFQMKHEVLNDKTLNQERKDEMSRQVGLKIMATLTADQMGKLNQNPELLQSLKGPSEKMAEAKAKK